MLLLLSRLLHVSCLALVVRTKAPMPPPPSRRDVLQSAASLLTVGSTLLTTPLVSHANDDEQVYRERNRGGKPFAPLEALLPATRLKLWVDQAHVISSSLEKTKDKDTQYATLQQLNNILSNPPKLFLSSPPKTSNKSPAMAQLTTSVNKEQNDKRNRSSLNIATGIASMLNQADVERQWGMLQYQESKLEQGNEFRAALNYYTSQLQFGNSYLLTASEQDRKRMIRNEQLPTVTAVITSDLDVRELYRNTFLTTIEDARAEVAFQLKQSVETVDTTDVIVLMNQAYTACTEWFSLIAPQDVQDAIEAVAKDSDRVANVPVW